MPRRKTKKRIKVEAVQVKRAKVIVAHSENCRKEWKKSTDKKKFRDSKEYFKLKRENKKEEWEK